MPIVTTPWTVITSVPVRVDTLATERGAER